MLKAGSGAMARVPEGIAVGKVSVRGTLFGSECDGRGEDDGRGVPDSRGDRAIRRSMVGISR